MVVTTYWIAGYLMMICQLHGNRFSWGLKTDDRRITKTPETEMFIISEIRKMVTMLAYSWVI
jgi:hypothetical protein